MVSFAKYSGHLLSFLWKTPNHHELNELTVDCESSFLLLGVPHGVGNHLEKTEYTKRLSHDEKQAAPLADAHQPEWNSR